MKSTPDGKDANVLSKPPEEIKKGLDACRDPMSVCDEVCPYSEGNKFPKCREAVMNDALAYIEQLESDACNWEIEATLLKARIRNGSV